MERMDKETYIRILRRKLNGLNEEDIEDAIDYVSEYFDEAGEENLSSVLQELGSPSKFAATIKANNATRDFNTKDHPVQGKTSASNLKKIVTICLGICALPIALPLIMVMVALMLVFFILIIAFVVAAFSGFMACIVNGIPLMIRSFLLIGDTGNSLLNAGASLISIGIGILLMIGCSKLVRIMIPAFTRFITRLYTKLKGEQSYEKE